MSAPIVGGKGHLPKRVRGGRGYLLIDNQHSPVPLTYKLANGELLVVAAGETAELPTLTCCHCNCMVVLHPTRCRPRGWCRRCNAYCCDSPGCHKECTPTEACIDLALRQSARLQAEGKDLATAAAEDFLGRAKDGSVLFDRSLYERGRVF